ncbi:MAG: hypothetical protein ACETWM_19815 [Candidatus Lokiarchaeia archaeon]
MIERRDEKSKLRVIKSLGNFLKLMSFGIKHRKILKVQRQAIKTGVTLALVNIELGKMSYHGPIYPQRVMEFNHAMIELTKAKWHAAKAMENGSKDYWKKAFKGFKKSKDFSEKLYNTIISGSPAPIDYEKAKITSKGTEISFADDVPLVPEICPVVILQGSDYDMGCQYAQQLIQIFGPWILERKAGRSFTQAQTEIIKKWEEQIRQYAPEILDFCKGWAAGATDAGVQMSYYDVLDLWTGHNPPASDYFGGLPDIGPPLCSGAAAWGRATVDGKLVTGCSGDHNCTYMVTIVAFPETGNNFMYTSFGATGDVPIAGACYFFGHPGMNNKGLAYVHHGGGPKLIEPKEYWGYGIRRAVSVLHVLRFANSAKEAREMEMTFPVGDIGPGDQATAGGFYADSNYGYVIESRKDPVIIREAGMMGEKDFLYANNSAIHPDASKARWMHENMEEWIWHEHGGWYPKKFAAFSLFSLKDPFIMGMKWSYANSSSRNRYMFKMMNRAVGHIDFEYMKMMYRKSGTLPPGSWKDITVAYNKGGWEEISTGNAANALVALMKPHNGEEGIYALCIGPARRGLTPMSPRHCMPIYGETNAFWELKLASSTKDVVEYARQKAQEYIRKASSETRKLKKSDVANLPLKELLDLAQREFESGKNHQDAVKKASGNEAIYNWAKSTRAFTRAQIRALQVYQALVPPPSRPKDLVFEFSRLENK